MRHVDHAHQAIRDGQPQCHQQQDRAQAGTREKRAQALAPAQTFLHSGQRSLNLFLDRRLLLISQALVEQQQGLWLFAVGQLTSGQQTVVRCIAVEQRSRTGLAHQALHSGIFFSRQRFFQQRLATGIRLFEQ